MSSDFDETELPYTASAGVPNKAQKKLAERAVSFVVSDSEYELIGREVCQLVVPQFTTNEYIELGRRFLSTAGCWYLHFLQRAQGARGTHSAYDPCDTLQTASEKDEPYPSDVTLLIN